MIHGISAVGARVTFSTVHGAIFEGATFATQTIPGSVLSRMSEKVWHELDAFALTYNYILENKVVRGMELLLCVRNQATVEAYASNEAKSGFLANFKSFSTAGGVLAVASEGSRVRYVSHMIENNEKGWTYKLVSIENLLRYICMFIRLEELDAAATEEHKACDEVAELKHQNWQLGVDLSNAEREAREQKLRADGLVKTLERFAMWIWLLLTNEWIILIARITWPKTLKAIRRALEGLHSTDREVTVASLINGSEDPQD